MFDEQNRIYDVVVVGAGPAGSTAAYQIENRKVLIIDKCVFPRDKACGGGLLNSLDWPAEFLNFKNIRERLSVHPSDAAVLYAGRSELVRFKSNHLIDHVERKEFDQLLLEESLKKENVEFRQFELKSIERDGDDFILSDGQEEIRAGQVIGADGVNSVVARLLGNAPLDRTTAGICLEREIICPKKSQVVHVFFGYGLEIGYAWVFPTARGYYVGLGYVRKTRKKLEAHLDDFLAECVRQEIIPAEYSVAKTFGGMIPVQIRKHVASERVFLCGDAAGLVNQWNGEGIYFAMKSGQIIGQLINRAEGSEIRKKYVKRVRKLARITTIIPWIPPKPLTIPFWAAAFGFIRLTKLLGLGFAERYFMNRFARRLKLSKESQYRSF